MHVYIYMLYTYTLYQPLYHPLDGLGPEILPKGRSDQDSPWKKTQNKASKPSTKKCSSRNVMWNNECIIIIYIGIIKYPLVN